MGIKTVPKPPYISDHAPCDFCLFPKLRGCRYKTFDEMKEAVTNLIDTLTQENFHGAFEELLEQVHWSRRKLPRRGLEFHMCTNNKSNPTKKVWKLIYWSLYIYIYICVCVYIYICVCVCVCACVCMCVPICIYLSIYLCSCTPIFHRMRIKK